MNRSISGNPMACIGDRRLVFCVVHLSSPAASPVLLCHFQWVAVTAEAAWESARKQHVMRANRNSYDRKKSIFQSFPQAVDSILLPWCCISVHIVFCIHPLFIYSRFIWFILISWFSSTRQRHLAQQRKAHLACQTRRLRRIEINPWKVNHFSAVETSL